MGFHAMQIAALAQLIAAIFLATRGAINTAGAAQVMPGCPDRCGAVEIQYPFGVGESCYLEEKFKVICDVTNGTSPTLYMDKKTSNIEITNMSIDSGELQIMQYIARECYTATGLLDKERSNNPELWFSSFTISSTKNRFFAIGCDTYAIVRGYNRANERFITGCMSLCDDEASISGDSCSGVGCCEASIPAGLKNGTVRLSSYYNHTDIWDFNPCSYAFIAEAGRFSFSGVSSFRDLDDRRWVQKLPMIVDWSVGAQSCAQAKAAGNVTYCKGNSACVDSMTGVGYLCECLPGYEGNPYHPDGCQDIDECKIENRCNGTCTNTPGSYSCSCSKGFTLKHNGTVCIKNDKSDGPRRTLILYVSLGVSIGALGLVFLSLMLCWGHRKRKLMRQKEKFFEQNGGLMLQRRISTDHKKRIIRDSENLYRGRTFKGNK